MTDALAITDADLVAHAAAVVNHRRSGSSEYGQVGAALITPSGAVHVGVCIDTSSGMGFCAEHAAIAAMITAGESRIVSIVAVWKDEHGTMTILPPCGRCREFIRQVDETNLDARVILKSGVVALRDLLPYHDWPT